MKVQLKVKEVTAIGSGMARVGLEGAAWNWMSFTAPISMIHNFPLTGMVTVEVLENVDSSLGFSCCRESTPEIGHSAPLHACTGQQCGHTSEDHQ